LPRRALAVYAKLSVVAPKALCNPGPSCPRAFAFTKADRQHASVDFERGIERTAYEKLMPLGYKVFKLTRHDDNGQRVGLPAAVPRDREVHVQGLQDVV
jgi:hypothetical protein